MDIGERCALIAPKKKACRSKSVHHGGSGSRFFNQYRLLMDSTRDCPRRFSGLEKSLSPSNNHRNNSIAGLNSLKPSTSDHGASTLRRFRFSSNDYDEEQVTRQPSISTSTEHSLKVLGPLSTSNSSPTGFKAVGDAGVAEGGGYIKLDDYKNITNKSYPFISVLERDGAVSNRKLSYDSSYQWQLTRQPRRHDHLGPSGKPMDLNVPVRWSARSRTDSVVGALPNIPHTMKNHKHSAPAVVIPAHSAVQLRVSGDMDTDQTQPQQNPLWNVSNEYMKVSGYTSPFNKLLSIKRKKGTDVTVQQLDLEKANEDSKNDPNGTSAQGLDVNNKSGAKAHPRSVYGRLYQAPMNQKQLFKKRKDLFGKRIFICNLLLFFAAVGIILAIVEAELSASDVIQKTRFVSYFIRGVIVLSTLILLGLLIWYHATEIRITMIDSGAHDWRVALTADRTLQMIFELVLCSICPIPGNFVVNSVVLLDDHRQYKVVNVPLDVLLSLPMFLRFYLVGRFMALHSGQFQDAATRSIARLNRVTVDFGFVMKTLMVEHPIRVLFTFTVTFWLCISWILVQCERHDDINEQNHYLNAIWFTIITFMSIGYGDIVPNTYCGRVVAITIGIVGAGVSSALIAVMSLKLELSRAEKHVNNFMTDTKLSRQRKDAAAMVLQHTWFIHKYKGLQKAQDEIKLRFHQRKFLASINEFRRIKWDQRKLAEQGDALVDVAKLQSDMHSTLWDMQQTQNQLTTQVQTLTHRIQEMYEAIVLQNATKNLQVSNILSPASSLFVASPNVQQQYQLGMSQSSKSNMNSENMTSVSNNI